MSDFDFVIQSAIKSLILYTYVLFNLFSPMDSTRLEKATAARAATHSVSCFSVYLGKATEASRAALPSPASARGVSVFTWTRLQRLQSLPAVFAR